MHLRILLLFALPPLAFGQDTLALSLKRSVEIALAPDGNTRIALAQESIRQAETRVVQAKSAFLPNFDASLQARDQTTNLRAFGLNVQLPPQLGVAFPTLAGPFTVVDARATAQQSVLDFTTMRRYQATRSSLTAIRDDLDTAKSQVSDQVARAYLTALRAKATVDMGRANVELAKALVTLATNLKDAGTGTGIEVTRAQVQLANEQQRLIVAENNQHRANLQLLRAMGLQLQVRLDLTDKLEFRPVDVSSLESSLETARRQRAELKAQQQREQTARLNSRAVTAERLPSLGVFGDYGSIGTDFGNSLATRTFGLSLKVPIFDGGRREARHAESESQFRQETLRTRDLREQIELEVRIALDNLRSAENEIQTAREGLSLAENELAQAQRRYQAGVTNSVEITDAQTRLDRARDNQIAALFDYNLARLDLATATGTIGDYVNQ